MSKSLLIDWICSKVDWRELKAAEYPDDDRNASCAADLRELADFVRSLPDDDERVDRLVCLCTRDDQGNDLGVFVPGDELDYCVSRFGFHNPSEDPDRFLSQLVKIAVSDEVRYAEEHSLL